MLASQHSLASFERYLWWSNNKISLALAEVARKKGHFLLVKKLVFNKKKKEGKNSVCLVTLRGMLS